MLGENVVVSDDGLSVIVPVYDSRKTVEVPVAVLKAMADIRLSGNSWGDLLRIFNTGKLDGVTGKFAPANIVPISELVGVDLVGKKISVFFGNWEDSEWLWTSNAVTVESNGDGYYQFNFGAYTKAWADESEDEDEDIDIPHDVISLLGVSFYASEKVTIHQS